MCLATAANDQRAELATDTVVRALTKLPSTLPTKLRVLPVALVAGFSGFCSLIYQVTWDRTVRFNFGGDPVSSAIVTSSFLLGLGIGAVAFGSWRRHPLRVLGLVEIGIGSFAIVSFYYLAPLSTTLATLMSHSIADAEGMRGVVILGCVLFLVPPAVLMGGTLPLMFNWFIGAGEYRPRAVGAIYGLNTLGASAGILCAPFVFLNHISIPATLATVGLANVAFGLTLLTISRRASGAPTDPPAQSAESPAPPAAAHLRLPLMLSFISGFTVLAFEMTLFRRFYAANPSSPYNFPAVLMPFLLALALGAIFLTRFRRYSFATGVRRIGALLALAQAAMLLSVWISARLEGIRFWDWTQPELWLFWLGLIVPFAFVSGAVFPLLLRLAAETGKSLPRSTGRVYLANSLGAFAGGLLTQLVGFSTIGTRGVLLLLFYLSLATAAFCVARAGGPRRIAYLAGVVLVAGAQFFLPSNAWRSYAFHDGRPKVEAVEGISGIASITWNEDFSIGAVKVNGQYMATLPDHPKHVRLAAFVLAPRRRRDILVLGLGGGGMVREFAQDRRVDRIDAVDWSYELVELLQRDAPRRLLRDALDDPKVTLFRTDARVAVSLYEAHSFDIVVDNLSAGNWVGATSIKSVEFYRQVDRILRPTGIFVYDANFSGQQQRAANLAALRAVFPVVLDHPEGVVLASQRPISIAEPRAERLIGDRAAILGASPPFADWLIAPLRPVSAADLDGASPIRDALLTHEYTVHPLQHQR